MASEVKSDLRFEISDLNYPYIHVHILPFKSQFLDLRGHCGLQTASEVKSDLGLEISGLNYPHIHVHVTLLTRLRRIVTCIATNQKNHAILYFLSGSEIH